MKTLFLIIIFGLTLSGKTKANQDCRWTSRKSGLTIHFVASCSGKNQILLDSFVNKVVAQLNHRDTSLKILVFLSLGQLSFPNAQFSNFFSIAYDTLREIDDDYIFNYYWNEQTISSNQNGGSNMFESRKVPLDINSTNNKATNDVGIKIIYDLDYRLGETNWVDIIKLILYAANNVDVVKAFQLRDTVRYNTNGWYLSLVTLDSARIDKILGKEIVDKPTQKEPASRANTSYYIIAGLAVLITLGFSISRPKHSR